MPVAHGSTALRLHQLPCLVIRPRRLSHNDQFSTQHLRSPSPTASSAGLSNFCALIKRAYSISAINPPWLSLDSFDYVGRFKTPIGTAQPLPESVPSTCKYSPVYGGIQIKLGSIPGVGLVEWCDYSLYLCPSARPFILPAILINLQSSLPDAFAKSLASFNAGVYILKILRSVSSYLTHLVIAFAHIKFHRLSISAS